MPAGKYNAGANSAIEYWLRKANIDKINWEKLFDRSADHKNVIYRDTFILIISLHSYTFYF